MSWILHPQTKVSFPSRREIWWLEGEKNLTLFMHIAPKQILVYLWNQNFMVGQEVLFLFLFLLFRFHDKYLYYLDTQRLLMST